MATINNTTRYIAAGFQAFYAHRLDSHGLPAGLTGTCTPGADGAAAFKINAGKTLSITTPAGETVPVTGDNVLQGNFTFENVSVRAFDVQLAEDNFDERIAFQGIRARNFGNFSMAGRDIQPFTLDDLLLIGISNARAQQPGVKGQGLYAGIWTKPATMVVRGRDTFNERAAAAFLGTVTLNPTDSYPWGETFQIIAGHEGFSSAFVTDWTLPYPVSVHRWTQSSGVTRFNFTGGENPASASLSDHLIYTIDTTTGLWVGPYAAGVTVDIANPALVFSPAPTAAYDIVDMYGFTPS